MKRQLFPLLLAVVLGAVGAGIWFARPAPSVAQPEGVAWQKISVDEALNRARAENKRVFLSFSASWCPYCQKLEHELLDQPEGRSLLSDFIPIQIDFDAPENRPLIERFVVLVLPTCVVLTGDGTQVARIIDYETKAKWIAELRAAKVAGDPLPALRAAFAADPHNAEKALRLGEALLTGGHADEGERLLEQVDWMQPPPAAGAEALFTLGRYHHRVRRDAAQARHIWRELALRYPDEDFSSSAWSWYAKAEAELGHIDVGLRALEARLDQHPDNTSAVLGFADYVADKDVRAEFARAKQALEQIRPKLDADDQKDAADLLTKLGQ